MEKRTYHEAIEEIQRHWATEGMMVNSGDDGFSKAVLNIMHSVGGDDPRCERNKFYGRVYRILKTNFV